MKKIMFSFLLTVIVGFICCAQKTKKPRWLSQKGFWVVESNVKTPKSSVIYFFNNDNIMVYKEQVEGLKLRINRPKVKMSLKQILEQSVTAWEQQHIFKQNNYLVATALRK